jgi:hypothetical protein
MNWRDETMVRALGVARASIFSIVDCLIIKTTQTDSTPMTPTSSA